MMGDGARFLCFIDLKGGDPLAQQKQVFVELGGGETEQIEETLRFEWL
jgi:hypothetical protein